ncbi:MAG: hypothetical protein JWM59_2454 [Verrucomicrobiales bacterium]|nr:hypothetical protein [Verrucomicrobiales bacterium]
MDALSIPPTYGAMTAIESSRAVQEVQAAMIVAKRFPRDEVAAVDRIINACTRPALANSAVYQYSRGGTDITGPSIRLAEAIAQNWGNLQFGIRELESRDGESTAEAFAWDLQTNTRQTKTFQVQHLRYTRNGSKQLNDPRDIYELVANNGARRLRACILGVIPGDVVEAALAQCETTMAANADTSPEAQQKIVAAFGKYGVTKEQLEARIQRRMDSITAAQVIALRKIMSSLKDGMSSPEEWFPKLQGASSESVDPFTAPAGAAATSEATTEPTQPQPGPESPAHTALRDLITSCDFQTGSVLRIAKGLGITSAPSLAMMSATACQEAIDRWNEVEAEMEGNDQ